MNFVSNNFNRYTDYETQRQKRNATSRQQRNVDDTKEGVIVNNFIKDTNYSEMDDLYTSMMIPKNAHLPEELKSNHKEKGFVNNPLFPLCAATLGVLGGAAGITHILKNVAKKKTVLPDWQKLPDIPRNMNLNKESHFVTYVTVQNPNSKTILSALAFFAFSSCVFILKNFVDGFKDVWVKKQDAEIQKNLQEKLINVETSVFSGKMQIVRQMMSEKANIFKNVFAATNKPGITAPPTFESDPFKNFKNPLSFQGKTENSQKDKVSEQNKQNKGWKMLLAGGTTIVGSIFLTRYIMKNVRSTVKSFEIYNDGFLKQVQNILDKTTKEKTLSKEEQAKIKDIFAMTSFKPSYAKEVLTKAGVPEDEVKTIVDSIEKKTQHQRIVSPPESLGGRLGIQYYTFIDDVQGHFYNWIMNPDMPLMRYLFFALSTVSALGYLGKTSVEAVKEVQIKKANAETELGLQKNLINVELRNFYAKKRVAIDPLMEEFEKKRRKGANNEELKTMSENILFEIKNGAPFVYS